jgi:hypothetical protein
MSDVVNLGADTIALAVATPDVSLKKRHKAERSIIVLEGRQKDMMLPGEALVGPCGTILT